MSVNETRNFASSIDSWVAATKDRMTRVFRESTQRVASLANNGVPVDLGFARASIQASTEEMPSIDPTKDNKAKKVGDLASAFGQVTAVIANARLGQVIYVGWTAAYVLPLEFGHSQQAPSGFVRIAIAQWDHVVARVTEEAKARAA